MPTYSNLVDATRRLDPEEMAELHLEQGFIDRALAIYEELVQSHPENATYATRRAWLARLAAANPPKKKRPASDIVPVPRVAAQEPTLAGVGAPIAKRPPEIKVVRRLRIVDVR